MRQCRWSALFKAFILSARKALNKQPFWLLGPNTNDQSHCMAFMLLFLKFISKWASNILSTLRNSWIQVAKLSNHYSTLNQHWGLNIKTRIISQWKPNLFSTLKAKTLFYILHFYIKKTFKMKLYIHFQHWNQLLY